MQGNSTGPVRAVAYYRMSTGKQEASIPEQKEWVGRAARAHGVRLLAEFQDDGIAGAEIGRRPGLMALVAYCEAHEVDAVVAWDADRFSRADSISTAVVLDQLRRAGTARLLTQEGGWVDLEDDVDRLLFNIKQDMTRAAYSKGLSRNVARSALQRAREGKWVAGRPPHAYVVGPDGHLAFGDPVHVETIRWTFAHFAATADSLGDVARRLREAGRPAPPPKRRKKTGEPWGGHWTRYLVNDVLHNRHYLGEIVWNATHLGRYSRVTAGEVVPDRGRRKGSRVVNGPEDRVIVPGAHPAIVDADTFAACQEKLARTSRRRRTTPQAGGGEWVLSGLLYCGHCGGRMGGVTDREYRGEKVYTYRHYTCRATARHGAGTCRKNAVLQETVLREVAGLIRESFTDPARMGELKAEVEALAREEDGNALADRARLRERLAALDRQIDQGHENLARLPADLIEAVVAKLRGWKDERESLAREVARLEEAAETGQRFVGKVTGALEDLRRLEEMIGTAPPALVRDVLAGLVDRITLHFEHGEDFGRGRRRTWLASLDVMMRPEAAHLLGGELWSSGNRTPQVTIHLRRRLPHTG